MPEGHSVHRLARVLTELFAGETVTASSPQGRFADGAALVDASLILPSQAWGKHLFIPFVNPFIGDTAPSGTVFANSDTGRPPSPGSPSPAPPDLGSRGSGSPDPDSPSPGSHAPCRENLPPPHSYETFTTLLEHEAIRWVHVHLGLYGRWVFNGGESFLRSKLLGVPHIIIGEGDEKRVAVTDPADDVQFGDRTDTAFPNDPNPRATHLESQPANGIRPKAKPSTAQSHAPAPRWVPPAPRGAVRLRLLTSYGCADLSGPNQCEIKNSHEIRSVLDRLGPDPLRNEPGDREQFIDLVRRRRAPVGSLVMDQSVAAGPGNIYRAETLFRVGVHPDRPGNKISRERLGLVWDDLVKIMTDGLQTGTIQTVEPELAPTTPIDGDPEASRWAVYHRTGRPCLRCGRPVRERLLQGRRLFWCSGCQR